MVYEVMLAYANSEKAVVKQIVDVCDVVIEDGIYLFRDTKQHILFSAPSDSLIYVQRISLG